MNPPTNNPYPDNFIPETSESIHSFKTDKQPSPPTKIKTDPTIIESIAKQSLNQSAQLNASELSGSAFSHDIGTPSTPFTPLEAVIDSASTQSIHSIRNTSFISGKDATIKTKMLTNPNGPQLTDENLNIVKSEWEAKALNYATKLGLDKNGYQRYHLKLTKYTDETISITVNKSDRENISEELLKQLIKDYDLENSKDLIDQEKKINKFIADADSLKISLHTFTEDSPGKDEILDIITVAELIQGLLSNKSNNSIDETKPINSKQIQIELDITPLSHLQLLCAELGLAEGACIAKESTNKIIVAGQAILNKTEYAQYTHTAIVAATSKDKIRLIEATTKSVGITELNLEEFIQYIGNGARILSQSDPDHTSINRIMKQIEFSITTNKVSYRYSGLISATFLSSTPTPQSIKAVQLTHLSGNFINSIENKSTAYICSELGTQILQAIQIESLKKAKKLKVIDSETIKQAMRERKILPLNYERVTPAKLMQSLEMMGYKGWELTQQMVSSMSKEVSQKHQT